MSLYVIGSLLPVRLIIASAWCLYLKWGKAIHDLFLVCAWFSDSLGKLLPEKPVQASYQENNPLFFHRSAGCCPMWDLGCIWHLERHPLSGIKPLTRNRTEVAGRAANSSSLCRCLFSCSMFSPTFFFVLVVQFIVYSFLSLLIIQNVDELVHVMYLFLSWANICFPL